MKKHVPFALAMVFGVLAAAYTFLEPTLNWQTSPVLMFEQKLLDLKFLWRGRVDVVPGVVIAAGDEKTIRSFGRWGTWDRRNFEPIVNNLRAAGADVVAFDMVFADPVGIDHASTVALGRALEQAKIAEQAMQLALAASEGHAPQAAALGDLALSSKAIEDQFQRSVDGDARFAHALDEHTSNVVQGAVVNIVADDGKPRTATDHALALKKLEPFLLRDYGFGWKLTELTNGAAGAEASVAALDVHPGGKPSDLPAIEAQGEMILPDDVFLEVANNVGFFSAYVDPDGVLRRQPVVFRVGENFLPALALSAASAHFGATPLLFADSFYRAGFAKIGFPVDGGVVEVPVDLQGRLLVNYYGPGGPNDDSLPDDQRGVFPRVSLSDVACADLPPHGSALFEEYRGREALCAERALDLAGLKRLVDGKIVMVAVTATGTFDQRVTPFSANVPGTEVHAAAIQNMLDGKALRRPALHVQVEMMVCVVVALLFGLLLPRLSVGVAVAFVGSALGAWWLINWNVLFPAGRWFHDVPFLLQTSMTWAAVTAWGYLTTGREKARLKAEFSTVLAPTVVDQLLVNPALAGLGGAERELTVMFSDIRGFTTMSEKLSPEGLTQFLNEYLTPMTDILIRHEGTLDKYMGDAIMAFWGAPIEQKDHAKRACITAVEMCAKLDELKAKWRAEGKPEIDIGIGLNSGLMRVGFMGSARMRNYTLLGDNVNLGSRLEGTNKNYGTHIIVSETTFKAAGDAVHGRWLDAVRVKGKKEPVNIYEVIGKGQPPASVAAFTRPFEEGLRLYRAMRWDDAEKMFLAAKAARGGDDPPSEVYLERLAHFREEPPPSNWDGVYEFKTK
jgi:adenylate cyclase